MCLPLADALDLEMFGEELAGFWGHVSWKRKREGGQERNLPAHDPRGPGIPGASVPEDEFWKVGMCAQPTATHRAPVATAHEILWLLPLSWPSHYLEEKGRWEEKPMILLACCQLLRQFLQEGEEL